ncbi:MAG: TonB-dependent receptor [Flavobacteriaceae bacterium]|nr:MAG: TonB-dependent receptor [Flavobacteriaceae bacterium]
MNKIYISLCFALLAYTVHAQNNIKGTVTDTQGVSIVGATISVSKYLGTTTNFEGRYLLSNLKPQKYQVTIQSIGYKTKRHTLLLSKEFTVLNIRLQDDLSQLDEVVISASRSSEKLSEIPTSITVVGTKKLASLLQATSNINEILEFAVPGLAPSTGTYSNWGQTLRGRQLLVMIDGVPQSTPLRNAKVGLKTINPFDIARVEVIKGATAIFGNGGDGGIVNYITKKPVKGTLVTGSTNVWGTGNLAKFNNDALGWGISQSLSGSKDNFSYYVSGNYEKTGDKYDADGDVLLPTYSLGNTTIKSGFAKLVYDFSDNQSLLVKVSHYQTRQKSPYVATIGGIEVFNADGDYKIIHGIGVLPTDDNPMVGGGTGITTTNAQLQHQLHGLFNNTTSLVTDVFHQKSKNIFFYSPNFEGGGQSVVNSEKFGIRPNFHSKFDFEAGELSFTYGLDILKDKTNQGLLDGRLWVPNLDMFSYAPYMQSKFKFNDAWVVKVGVRYDDMNLEVVDFNSLPYSPKGDGNFNPSVAVEGGTLKFKNTAFNIGFRYIENDAFIPYVSYSQGFSLPDIGATLRRATANNVNDIDLQAVETNNFELGFLSLYEHVKFEAVGFYSTSNLGVGLKFNDEENRFEMAKNPQKIFGAEVSVDFTFLEDKLQFGGSYSYVEGLKHSADNPHELTYIGGDVISPPKVTAYVNVAVTEKFNTSLRLVLVGDRERFNVQEKAGNFSYNYREVPVKSYSLLSFSANYAVQQNVTVSFAVNNMLNEFYLPARAQWASVLRTQSPAGEGANAKLGIAFKF